MDYSKILSISGMPGLFELVNNRTDGGIVKSLQDGIVKFVSVRSNTFSQLESIEIFTIRENVNLSEVFLAMEKSEEPLPLEKDPKAVKNYFEIVYPDIDFDRVYYSDMKKMVKWFGILKKNNIEIKLRSQEDLDGSTEIDTESKSDEVAS
jgi:hypothetical protein